MPSIVVVCPQNAGGGSRAVTRFKRTFDQKGIPQKNFERDARYGKDTPRRILPYTECLVGVLKEEHVSTRARFDPYYQVQGSAQHNQ